MLATQALSTMPDVRSAVEIVHEALKPGGRFGIYGLRLVPAGPGRVLNPLVLRVYRFVANWNESGEPLEELRRAFGDAEVVSRYALGTSYVAVAAKADDPAGTGSDPAGHQGEAVGRGDGWAGSQGDPAARGET